MKERVTAMFCHNCGAALAEKDRFCASCGTQRRNATTTPVVEHSTAVGPPTRPLGGGSRYVNDNLIGSENVLFQTRQHRIKLTGPMGVGACLLLLCLIAGIQGESGIAWILFLIAAIVMGKSYLQWKATDYALTNKRIIVKSGILRRTSEEIMVDKVESIAVDQGLWGRQFNYGKLVLRGTGSTFEPFAYVPRPMEFRKCILGQAASR